MRHSANRATRASGSASSASVCPFHLQDGRFTVSHPAFSTTQHASSALVGWTFRFCSGAKALALRPCGRCNSTRGAEFPQASLGSKAAHQLASPNTIMRWTAIKILEALFCCMFIYGVDG